LINLGTFDIMLGSIRKMNEEARIIKKLAGFSYKRKDYKRAWLFYSELYNQNELEKRDLNQFLTCCRVLNKPNIEELFRASVNSSSTDFHLKRNFIEFLITQNKYEEAESLVDQILEEYEDDFYAIDIKAKILSQTDRIVEAIEVMDAKINMPKLTMSRNIHGEDYEIRKTFNAYQRMLAEYSTEFRIKDEIFHQLVLDGLTVNNPYSKFDKIECNEDILAFYEHEEISADAREIVKRYSIVANKMKEVLSIQKEKRVFDKFYDRKLNFLNQTTSLISRLKHFLVKVYSEEKLQTMEDLNIKKKVFISYSRTDRKFAIQIKEALENVNMEVVIDEVALKLNDYLEGKLRHLIRDADYVLSLVSKESLISEWVGLESVETLLQERFQNENKKFISVVVDKKVFDYDFYIELLLEIDVKIEALLNRTVKVTKLRASSYLFDKSRERLFQLRNNLGTILLRIREHLAIEFKPSDNFETKFESLLTYLEEPKNTA
jgi:hypothetical protein